MCFHIFKNPSRSPHFLYIPFILPFPQCHSLRSHSFLLQALFLVIFSPFSNYQVAVFWAFKGMYSLGRDTFAFSNRNLQLSVGPSATREQLRTRVLAIPTCLNIMSFFKVRLCLTSTRFLLLLSHDFVQFSPLSTFVNGCKVQAKSAFY